MTTEEAKLVLRSWGVPKGREYEAIMTLIPELAESEDERIKNVLYGWVSYAPQSYFNGGFSREQILSWIDKQKERDLDIVPELRPTAWGEGYQHGCKDTEEKYSGMMVCSPEEWNEAISDAFKHGMDEGEKQKEKKPNIELIQKSWYMEGYHDREFNKEPKWIIKTGEGGPRYEENPKYGQHIEKQDYSGLNELERAIHRGFLCAGVENVPVNIIKETAQDCLAHLPVEWSEDFDKEVENVHKRYPEVSYAKLTRIAYHFSKLANRYKRIKWSEEDEKIYTFVYDFFENCWWSTSWEISREQALKMLKFLRLRLAWKPSEEQMYSLGTVVKGAGNNSVGSIAYNLKELYEQLKKL